jgi:hypothetical protein
VNSSSAFQKLLQSAGEKITPRRFMPLIKIAKELATDPQLRQQVVELKGRLYA